MKGELNLVTAEAGGSWSIDDAGFVTIEVFDRSQKSEVVTSLTKQFGALPESAGNQSPNPHEMEHRQSDHRQGLQRCGQDLSDRRGSAAVCLS